MHDPTYIWIKSQWKLNKESVLLIVLNHHYNIFGLLHLFELDVINEKEKKKKEREKKKNEKGIYKKKERAEKIQTNHMI